MATPQPPFSGPITLAAGTRRSSRKTSLNSAPPVACFSGRTSMPGLRMSTAKKVMPRCLGASQSVRARSMPQSATWADEVQTFWPLTTYSSPSRSALVRSPARSEPALGSLKSWHHTWSPRRIGGEELLLLLLGAVGDDRRAHHADRLGEHAGGHVVVALLLEEDALLQAGEAPAAVLDRPGQAGPAVLGLGALPVAAGLDVGLLVLGHRRHRHPQRRRVLALGVGREELTALGAERRLFRCLVEVHGVPLACAAALEHRSSPIPPDEETDPRPSRRLVSGTPDAGSIEPRGAGASVAGPAGLAPLEEGGDALLGVVGRVDRPLGDGGERQPEASSPPTRPSRMRMVSRTADRPVAADPLGQGDGLVDRGARRRPPGSRSRAARPARRRSGRR